MVVTCVREGTRERHKETREVLRPFLGQVITVTGTVKAGQAKSRGALGNRTSAKIFLREVYHQNNYVCEHVVIADASVNLKHFRALKDKDGKTISVRAKVVEYDGRYGLDYVG